MDTGQSPTELHLRELDFCGRQVLGGTWTALCAGLRESLQKGCDAEEHLRGGRYRYAFPSFSAALQTWLDASRLARHTHQWPADAGPLPVQVLLRGAVGSPVAGKQEPRETAWESLQPEIPYFTPDLIQAWEGSGKGVDPSFSLQEDRVTGYYRLQRATADRPQWLTFFPARELPAKQSGRQCFYCGLRNHHPSNCPSKYLEPDLHGISRVGYMPLQAFGAYYGRAFTEEARLRQVIAQGVDSDHLRADPILQAYVSFFDLTRVYQLRFLFYLSFGYLDGWPGLGPLNAVKVSGSNILYLGLDCLRVGNRNQAVGMLRSLEGVNNEYRFGAEVGLAFVAMEENLLEVALEHLHRAEKYADKPEQQTYMALLLSRFYEVYGGDAGIGKALSSVYDILGRCRETEYRIIQLSARDGLAENMLTQLQNLIQRDRTYFYVALIDPQLLPVQGPVDNLLASIFQHVLDTGTQAYQTVRAEWELLRDWVESSDRSLQAVTAGLASLRERLEQESYFGFSDLVTTSRRLHDSCQGIRERRVARLLRNMDSVRRRCESLEMNWNNYPYKRFFKNVPGKLRAARKNVEIATELVVKENTAAYKEADATLKKSTGLLVELEKLWPEMAWLWNALEFGRRFSKRLLICEVGAVLLSLLALPALDLVLRGNLGSLAGSFIGSTNFRRFAAFSLIFFFAPAVALLLSLFTHVAPGGGVVSDTKGR